MLSTACCGPYLLVFPPFLFGCSPHSLPTLPPTLSEDTLVTKISWSQLPHNNVLCHYNLGGLVFLGS